MNQEVESRLAKLENCCADYRTQIGELEERVRGHREEERRLQRTYQEMEERLRETHEGLERRLHRATRPPERAEAERASNPEFERDADRLVLQLKVYTKIKDDGKRTLQDFLSTKHEFGSRVYSFISSYQKVSGMTGFQHQFAGFRKTILDEWFELYEKTIQISQLYKLAGKFSLAEKYRQDGEKLYDELQQIEDMLETKWQEWNDVITSPYGHPSEHIWDLTRMGRRTLPTSGHLEGAVSTQKASEGGRKTRKNKVLHKR